MARIKRRAVKWKSIGNIILITAVIIALYPLLTDFYAWYQKSQLTEQYKQVNLESNNASAIPDSDSEIPELDPELVWAMLEIPDIEVETPVIMGTSQEKLTMAPGWYPETALPGYGNTVIAGHRTMYGAPFRHLAKLKPGDKILLTYDRHMYRYQVEEVKTIPSDDWSVIEDCGYPALTLTTCTPDGQDKRLSVRARLIND